MPSVLLATWSGMPAGEPGAEHLDAALAEAGVDAQWAVWDDPTVDWAAADLVAVRATWDYEQRLSEFLAWADAVAAPLLNPAPVLRWNTDKAYLVELAEAGVRVVPTRPAATPDEVRAAVADFGTAVVKPRVGAGGRGVEVLGPTGSPAWRGPWVVQPLVESVRTVGEVSVFVVDGRAISRVDKRPAAGEIRVHDWYGGASVPVDLDSATAATATAALRTAGELLGTELAYGRVDLMSYEGEWVIAELELTEPGLYLDVVPGNAEPFAALVARLVGATARR